MTLKMDDEVRHNVMIAGGTLRKFKVFVKTHKDNILQKICSMDCF